MAIAIIDVIHFNNGFPNMHDLELSVTSASDSRLTLGEDFTCKNYLKK